ncbi:hypothetical protein Godav_006948 [Gossypium davidsonii]|uniref:Uncharacterized protein n=1 Tax=Gossypium davidsonii TaxID=34287 RepID=A0A7J8S5K9_GOSDV|nr:hypothetical protein [Gossypium davidsonii]
MSFDLRPVTLGVARLDDGLKLREFFKSLIEKIYT